MKKHFYFIVPVGDKIVPAYELRKEQNYDL